MNILVTGCNGQLGNHLRMAATSSKHNFFFTDIDTLDITDVDAVGSFFRSNAIDLTINCAAYTNVDRSEDEEDVADRVNHHAVAILANATREMGGVLIQISTDYVFGGDAYNTPCNEQLPTNPTGAYARTKLRGEEAIIASGCRYIIVRTAWLYSEYGKNFVKTMLNITGSRAECRVVYDQVGTPTYAGDLAKTLLHIVDTPDLARLTGIYNYSNEGVCSWFDFAKEIARQAGHTACDIQPCRSSEFPSKVVRPSYAVLDKSKIKKTFGLRIPYWTDSLSVCIKNIVDGGICS
ncbi:MAG: dTDP-4-dehydrorhamnose reductase [Bacteroidales bacterium]|nr:dTDP-4-dehydrorhamnose reductase [Bacteroidales bacterium]